MMILDLFARFLVSSTLYYSFNSHYLSIISFDFGISYTQVLKKPPFTWKWEAKTDRSSRLKEDLIMISWWSNGRMSCRNIRIISRCFENRWVVKNEKARGLRGWTNRWPILIFLRVLLRIGKRTELFITDRSWSRYWYSWIYTWEWCVLPTCKVCHDADSDIGRVAAEAADQSYHHHHHIKYTGRESLIKHRSRNAQMQRKIT